MRGSTPRSAPKFNNQNMKKQIIIAVATILATIAEGYFIGLNGLTALAIPMTVFLVIHTIERVSEPNEKPNV